MTEVTVDDAGTLESMDYANDCWTLAQIKKHFFQEGAKGFWLKAGECEEDDEGEGYALIIEVEHNGYIYCFVERLAYDCVAVKEELIGSLVDKYDQVRLEFDLIGKNSRQIAGLQAKGWIVEACKSDTPEIPRCTVLYPDLPQSK